MKKMDYVLLISVVILSLLGLMMIYSPSYIWASYKYDNPYKLSKEYLDFNKIDLVVNRVRNDLIKRGDMMSINDVVDILSIPLLGFVPDDENVVIATNQGEPLVGSNTYAGIAYMNITRRVTGEEVPPMEFPKTITFWTRISGIFKKKQEV